MSIDDACRAAFRGFLSRPSEFLPYYFLGLSLPAIVQTVWLVGALGAYATVVRQGRLDDIQAHLADAGPIAVDDPASLEATGEPLENAVAAAYSPELLAILGGTVVVVFVAFLLLGAVVSAGQIHAVYAVLRDRPAVRAGVDGIVRDYGTFAVLAVLEIAVAATVSILVLGTAGLVAAAIGPPIAFFATTFGVLVWLVALIAVRLSFLFAPQAVVVERVGAADAIRRNLGFVRADPLTTALYVVLVVAAGVLIAAVSAALSLLQATGASSLFASLLVVPVLDFVKTVLYADHATGTLPVPSSPEAGVLSRTLEGFRGGWDELWSFVASTPTLHAWSTAVIALGGGLGWYWGARLVPFFEASIARRLGDLFAPGFFVEIAANNWQVAVAQAYAGAVAGIPTIVTLFYNGAYLGILYQIETDPAALVAFVIPHGIVEIPSIVISGALGLYLGIVVLGFARGNRSRAEVVDAVERAYHVLIGLTILIVAAAAIEAFFSPFYHQFL